MVAEAEAGPALTTALRSLTPGASTSFPLFPGLLVHPGHHWDTPPGHASRTRHPDSPPEPQPLAASPTGATRSASLFWKTVIFL